MLRKQSKGFSLVEVLVALVVVSVGMLGVAGLYVHGMQAGRTAMFTHHAVTLAGDVADRIRANPRAGIAYENDGANNNCVAAGIDCNEEQMAENDIFVWEQEADAFLPNGEVTVEFDDGVTPPVYEITIDWTEPGIDREYSIIIPVLGI
ncbi:MAG: type IV pilus modification protein PilV [Pseudomonadota bacterium]